jgi:cupin superfamily acireductone dioxygenase involved in methionine salvage
MKTIPRLLVIGALGALASVSSAQNGRLILGEAPLDKAVDFPKEKLDALYQQMTKENLGLIRMLEGGLYNVNIRRVQNATPEKYETEFHEDTIDVWVITEGGGTLVTGGEEVDGKHRGGIEREAKVGDVIFIPAGIYHGFKNTRSTTWLNIRFPEHRN